MLPSSRTETIEQSYCVICLGNLLWDQENGERVCTKCGAVSPDAPDLVWQFMQSRDNLSSLPSSSSALSEQVGFSTVIGYRDVDARGKSLSSGRDLRQMRRLNTMVTWDSKKRRLTKISMEIRRITESLGLNLSVSERAYQIFIREFDAKSIRVKSTVAVAAASVCMACRELEMARPPDDVVALKANTDEQKLRHYYRIMLRSEPTQQIPSPASYISGIASKAGLKGLTERAALEIITVAKGAPEMVGKRPISIAAASLYLASLKTGDQTTQLRLAFAAGVNPITIRKRSQEISSILERTPNPS